MNQPPESVLPRWLNWLLPGVAIVALALGGWYAAQAFRSAPAGPVALHSGTLLPQPRGLEPFELVDQQGKPFNLDALRGRWSFIAFGFIQCHDVCPATLATFNGIESQLRDRHSATTPQFVFVSVDPEEDTPEKLEKFLHAINPRLRGATGTPEGVKALAGQLGIAYARMDGPHGEHSMDHSASLLLVDPQGRLTAIFSTPHDAQAVADDFLRLAMR
jgi:protein SCO1